MNKSVRFVVYIIIILVFSWLNNWLFGSSKTVSLPEYINQIAHYIILAITWFIGRSYLKLSSLLWLQKLWNITYIAALGVVIGLTGLYLITHLFVLRHWAADIRNVFISPLPLLVFFILQQVTINSTKSQP